MGNKYMFFFCKRVFDISFSIILMLILFPLLLVVTICIKLTSVGPVFFIQQRIGLQGVHFGIVKFRTMIVNAEKVGTGLDSYKDDPRVTKTGKFLRASSLDELPQLFNILIGDMSFVGPRPPVTYSPFKYCEYPEDAKKRFTVKPGVTGWAQVNGRNELSWDEKFKFDLQYLQRNNLVFDLYIIFLTVLKVIKNEGAFDKGGNSE